MASRANSLSGPDAMDISTTIRALEALHGVRVSLEMSVDGEHGEGGLELVAVAWVKGKVLGGALRSVSVKTRYPSSQYGNLEGALFTLVTSLDLECSVLWQQHDFLST